MSLYLATMIEIYFFVLQTIFFHDKIHETIDRENHYETHSFSTAAAGVGATEEEHIHLNFSELKL